MPLPNICTMEGDSLVYDLSLVGRPEDGNVGPAYLTPALSALSLLNLQDRGSHAPKAVISACSSGFWSEMTASRLRNNSVVVPGRPLQGRAPEPKNTDQALDFWDWRAWIPGSRAKPAPRNDVLPAVFRMLLELH